MNESTKRILLVEDDTVVGVDTMTKLKDEGYSVVHVSTGEKAVARMRESPDSFELILMDLDLGRGMDGAAAARTILSNHDIPVIFLSYHTEDEYVRKIEGIASYGFVVKNSGMTILKASIRMAFELFESYTRLQKQDAELSRTTAELKQLFSTNNDLLCISDLRGQFLNIDARWQNVFGVRASELEGKFFYDLVHPDDRKSTQESMKSLTPTHVTATFENRFMCGEGNYRYIEWRCYSNDGRIYLSARDITDRIEKERALELLESISEEFFYPSPEPFDYRKIADCVRVITGAAYVVFNTLDSEKRVYKTAAVSCVKDVVEEASQILGFDLREKQWAMDEDRESKMKGRRLLRYPSLSRFMNGLLCETVASGLETLLSTGECVRMMIEREETLLGDFIVLMPAGMIMTNEKQVLAVLRQIGMFLTRRRMQERLDETQNELRKNLTLLRNILNSTDDFIFVKDLQLRTILCNPAAAKAVGKTPEEMYGKTDIENGWDPVQVKGDPARGIRGYEEDDRNALAGNAVRNPYDRTVFHGKEDFYDTVKIPLYNEDGVIEGMLGIGRNVTERVAMEDELRRLLREKDLLVKELQHRVKNNLNIIGSILSLEARRMTDDNIRGLLYDIRSRVQTMSGIYEQLYRSGTIGYLDLDIYFSDYARNMERMYVYDTDRILISSQVGSVQLDLKRVVPLVLIMNELVTNAIKYAFPEKKEGEITIFGTVQGNNLEIGVSDNGVGFPDGFDPHRSESMGFMLVRLLCEQIGAAADFTSNPWKGTTVLLKLPIETAAG